MDLDKLSLDELVVEYSKQLGDKYGDDIPWRLINTPDDVYAEALRKCLREGIGFSAKLITGSVDALI